MFSVLILPQEFSLKFRRCFLTQICCTGYHIVGDFREEVIEGTHLSVQLRIYFCSVSFRILDARYPRIFRVKVVFTTPNSVV